MQYAEVIPAVFRERPNRFIAQVDTASGPMTVHVKNTGRCRELLVPGARVYIALGHNPGRRTPGDLIAVQKGDYLINMDSQAPNRVAAEALAQGLLLPGMEAPASLIRPEMQSGDSRLDFYIQWRSGPGTALPPPAGISLPEGCGQGFIEVKGVTLEREGAVFFPDAPTQRGVKHIHRLAQLARAGYGTFVLFVVQMSPAAYLAPNDETHPAFGEALREAAAAGVRVAAYDCRVEPDSLALGRPVEVQL